MAENNEEKKQVVYLTPVEDDDDNNKKEGGITFGDIGHHIWKYKYWVLGVTLLGTVAGAVFGVLSNKSKTSFSSTFTYNIPLVQTSNGYSFLDGSSYNYEKLISEETFKMVKDVNPTKYKEVDIEKIFTKSTDDISITQFKQKETVDGKEVETVVPFKYTITSKLSYFNGDSVLAKNFIVDLVGTALTISNNAVDNMSTNSYLASYQYAKSYYERINSLNSQYNYIVDSYAGIIDAYGSSLKYETKLVSTYLSEFKSCFNDKINYFYNTVDSKGYTIYNPTLLSYLTNQKTAYELDLKQNNDLITDLTKLRDETLQKINDAGITSVQSELLTSINNQIASLVTSNNDLTYKIKAIDLKIANINVNKTSEQNEFDALMSEVKTDLETYSNTFKQVASYVYKDNSNISYVYPSKILVTSGANWILYTGVGLLVGFVVSAFVVSCVGQSKKKEAK